MNKYVIGTGYVVPIEKRMGPYPGGPEAFFSVWWANTLRYTRPHRIFVLACKGNRIEWACGDWIHLDGDLGHVHDLEQGLKPYSWTGWSMTICTLALLAYANECDFIWKEQDTLAFGPWVEQMYAEIGSAGIIFGRARCMPAVQSLFLIKHAYIPEFVRLFLGTGDERRVENEGEQKFHRLSLEHPRQFTRYSFGYDRDRPFNMDDPVFYVQHLTPQEMEQLKAKGLI